ncbi:unnamed protein product [Gordionus sp. m RMFG-2023]
MQFQGQNIAKMGWFCPCSPMLIISRSREDQNYICVHKTEHVRRNTNPLWKPFSITVQKLCNADFLRTLKFDCYNWNSDESRKNFIGSFMTNLEELSHSVQDNKNFEIINSQRKKSSAVNAGTVSLILYSMRKIHTFLEFIKAGTQIHCTFAIDFTSSNGDPQNVNSLHHIQTDKNLLNQYELAITSVGDIIQDYDSDKLFPVLGFGARFPLTGMVSHEFFVNMKTDNPYCEGIPGVLDAYRNCLRQIQLYGPTNFAPVIKHVTKFASSYRDGSNYFILLIITDGIISDMPMTKEALVNASNLPISVIIVGVGDADFTAMEELDGDIIPLSSSNQTASRDIVQFVPLRDFQASSLNLSDRISSIASQKYRLAKEILAEIPLQFISYMNSIHATPELVANIKR